MKTIFRFIIAAMAAIAVFSSCQKELVNESASSTTDGVRTISVQFDNSTKASLNDLTPTFTNNDKIRVSNTEKSEECTVTVSEATATFTTTLSGALTAIYPAEAAVFTPGTSGTPDGPIVSPYFKVKAIQNGTATDAIIAKAEIADESSSATFIGQTALFQITPPSGTTSVTITSLNTIDPATGQRSATANAAAINTTGADDAAKREITVSVVGDKAYVSLVPGVNLTDLSFEYTVTGDTYDGAMKGIPAKDISAAGKENATAANKKYTINNENWHPYVTIGGKKWATMNVGATDTDPYGTYFSWGALEKVYTTLSGTSFTFGDNPDATRYTGTWTPGSCFAECNTPYYSGSAYSKYTTGASGDSKTVLDLADDAAYANWGGPWRMPTGGPDANSDFAALFIAANGNYTATKPQYTQTITSGDAPSNQGYYYYNVSGKTVGVYFVDNSSNKLFFPVAGYGLAALLKKAGSSGLYWSSSLRTDDPSRAYDMDFVNTHVSPQDNSTRCSGFSVRPVSD